MKRIEEVTLLYEISKALNKHLDLKKSLYDVLDILSSSVDETRCIGCGFCAGACPAGIWNLVENDPIG